MDNAEVMKIWGMAEMPKQNMYVLVCMYVCLKLQPPEWLVLVISMSGLLLVVSNEKSIIEMIVSDF